MKKVVVNLYIICLLAVAAVACSGPENGNAPVGNDTVYTEKAILNIYGSDPQRALTMIDSGLLVGTLDEDRATLLRARVYCYSPDEWPLDTVNLMLEGLLESDFAQKDPDNRQAVLDLLVYVSRRRGDNVAYLRWATEKADFCRQQGEETEALRTDAEIGAILTSMGEVEKGLSKLDGVIGALDNQRHFNEMDACIIALKRKIYVLCDIDRYDEVIPLANRMIEKLNDYREHGRHLGRGHLFVGTLPTTPPCEAAISLKLTGPCFYMDSLGRWPVLWDEVTNFFEMPGVRRVMICHYESDRLTVLLAEPGGPLELPDDSGPENLARRIFRAE